MADKELLVKIAFLTIGLLPFFAIGLLLVAGSIIGYLKTKSAVKWPSTDATITESSIKEKIKKERLRFKPQLSYSYSVDGRPFTGNTINFTGRRAIRSKSEAREFLTPYEVGAVVPLFYNPNNPTQCCLQHGDRSISLTTLSIGLLLAIVPGGIIIVNIMSLKG